MHRSIRHYARTDGRRAFAKAHAITLSAPASGVAWHRHSLLFRGAPLAETLLQAAQRHCHVMEPAIDAILEREQRNRLWAIVAANFVIVTAVTVLGAWLFPA